MRVLETLTEQLSSYLPGTSLVISDVIGHIISLIDTSSFLIVNLSMFFDWLTKMLQSLAEQELRGAT